MGKRKNSHTSIINPDHIAAEFLQFINTIYDTGNLTELPKYLREFSTLKFNQHLIQGVGPIIDFLKMSLPQMKVRITNSNVIIDGAKRLNILASGQICYLEDDLSQRLEMMSLSQSVPKIQVFSTFSMYFHLIQVNGKFWIHNQQIIIN